MIKPLSNTSKSTKNKLLESTLDLYLAGGLEAVSMRKVAAHAGLSTMATYRHFNNKDELLNHLVMEGFSRFQAYFNKARATPDPIASLKLCMTLYADFAQDQPAFFEILFLARLRTTNPALEQRCQGQIHMALRFLEERVKQCVEKGLTSSIDTKSYALRLWSFCHGMVSLQVLGQLTEQSDFEFFYQHSMKQFFVELGLD